MGATIITSLITAFTSIFVALITAGYFKKFMDLRKEKKSRKDLTNQFAKDEIIHFSLKEIKRNYDADRITITQFHNGGSFYTNSSMQKSSITYERMTDGLEAIAQKYQNILVNNFSWYYHQTLENNGFFYSVHDEVSDLATRSVIRSHGTNSHAAVPIFDKDKNLVATLALDWAFTEVPSEVIENDKFKETFKVKLQKDAQSLLRYL
jgi:hypothetical protein